MSASLSVSAWPPGLAPAQQVSHPYQGPEATNLTHSSTLKLSMAESATHDGSGLQNKWSPSSSLSGETELEARSQRSQSEEQHILSSKASHKEKVGDNESFFDLAPLGHELQSLEDD
ncbi:hypothetical protein EON65_36540, partial [archaeon]